MLVYVPLRPARRAREPQSPPRRPSLGGLDCIMWRVNVPRQLLWSARCRALVHSVEIADVPSSACSSSALSAPTWRKAAARIRRDTACNHGHGPSCQWVRWPGARAPLHPLRRFSSMLSALRSTASRRCADHASVRCHSRNNRTAQPATASVVEEHPKTQQQQQSDGEQASEVSLLFMDDRKGAVRFAAMGSLVQAAVWCWFSFASGYATMGTLELALGTVPVLLLPALVAGGARHYVIELASLQRGGVPRIQIATHTFNGGSTTKEYPLAHLVAPVNERGFDRIRYSPTTAHDLLFRAAALSCRGHSPFVQGS
eukprot:SAG31_NODE_2361_length_5869_cov_3.154246_3_plen_314_part_00